MFYVYILQSEKTGGYYKGFSENPFLRLQFHNAGRSPYTSRFLPWQLVAVFSFTTKSEALVKEKKLKKYPLKSLEALICSERNELSSYLKSLENY